MNSLGDARLYAILDLGYVEPAEALNAAAQLIRGGVDLIQLRAKKQSAEEIYDLAAQLHRLTNPAGVPLIINDHPEIARDLPVEGLHLGRDDLPLAAAREIVRRKGCWFGKSTHGAAQAVAAQAEGPDYIGFGPLFATPTKPAYAPIGIDDIRLVHELVELPIFCIGGIKLKNLPQVLAAGAKRVVIVSGLLQNADIAAATRAAKQLLANQQSEVSNQQ
ncbi:MAG: thiamine phosphate synthase [Chthoniobacterales bacterium]